MTCSRTHRAREDRGPVDGRARELGTSELGAREVGAPQHGATEIRATEVGSDEARTRALRGLKRGIVQIGAVQGGVVQPRLAQPGTSSARAREVGLHEPGLGEVRLDERGVGEVDAVGRRVHREGAVQARAGEHGLLQRRVHEHRPREIDARPRLERQVCRCALGARRVIRAPRAVEHRTQFGGRRAKAHGENTTLPAGRDTRYELMLTTGAYIDPPRTRRRTCTSLATCGLGRRLSGRLMTAVTAADRPLARRFAHGRGRRTPRRS